MPSKEATSVVFFPRAQQVKIELAPLYGLKRILSASLVEFAKLSQEEQIRAIREAQLPLDATESVSARAARKDEAAAASGAAKRKRTARRRKPAKAG